MLILLSLVGSSDNSCYITLLSSVDSISKVISYCYLQEMAVTQCHVLLLSSVHNDILLLSSVDSNDNGYITLLSTVDSSGNDHIRLLFIFSRLQWQKKNQNILRNNMLITFCEQQVTTIWIEEHITQWLIKSAEP